MVRAVLFDLGGVILPSPYTAIHKYYIESGFHNSNITFKEFIHAVHIQEASRNLIALFEIDEIPFESFCAKLNQVVHAMQESNSVWSKFDTKTYFRTIDQFVAKPDAKMISLVKYLRTNCKLKVGVITNNWFSYNRPVTNSQDELFCFKDLQFYGDLQTHFDFIIESRIVKMRKPQNSIFKFALNGLQLQNKPEEVLFIDDLGVNLKSAAAMGIKTIRCNSASQTIRDICNFIGISEAVIIESRL